ncbi:hypothetical protein NPIL_508721 [Nephila pilipes]|uniref:Uncharacterized protein n=1 Tax=Nephila pilipes TaxID=299642 RepID=A0A8X6R2M1_NEPPI|nr:hypothetical protein NPIL_508721 [Nephila pilipes]
MPNPINYDEIAKSQESDLELQNLINNPQGLQLKKIVMPNSDIPLFCDLSTGTARPYIPKDYRQRIFSQLHNMSHPVPRELRISNSDPGPVQLDFFFTNSPVIFIIEPIHVVLLPQSATSPSCPGLPLERDASINQVDCLPLNGRTKNGPDYLGNLTCLRMLTPLSPTLKTSAKGAIWNFREQMERKNFAETVCLPSLANLCYVKRPL